MAFYGLQTLNFHRIYLKEVSKKRPAIKVMCIQDKYRLLSPIQAPHSTVEHQAEIVLKQNSCVTSILDSTWQSPGWLSPSSLACTTTGFQTQLTCNLPAGTPKAPGCCQLTAHALHGTHRLLPVSGKCLAALQEAFLTAKCWQGLTVIIKAFYLLCFTLLFSEKERMITHSPWGL